MEDVALWRSKPEIVSVRGPLASRRPPSRHAAASCTCCAMAEGEVSHGMAAMRRAVAHRWVSQFFSFSRIYREKEGHPDTSDPVAAGWPTGVRSVCRAGGLRQRLEWRWLLWGLLMQRLRLLPKEEDDFCKLQFSSCFF